MESAATHASASTDGTVLREGDRHVVRFVRDFSLPAEKLWAMVTQPDLVQGWLGRVERFELAVDGAVDILLHPRNGAWLRGTVRAVEPPRLIEYGWTVPAHGTTEAFHGSWLRLEVAPCTGGARLTFSHSLPDGQRVLDILAASHLRLNQLPTEAGRLATVERADFLAQRAHYEKTISTTGDNTP